MMRPRYLVGVAAVLAAVMAASGCGSEASDDSAIDPQAGTTASPTPSGSASESPSPSPSPSIKIPDDFKQQMENHGYVLEDADSSKAPTAPEEAIQNSINFYALFTLDDPATADYFLVTTPNAGVLEDPKDPNSKVAEPTLNRVPMWVVYAETDLPKDESQPELGMVRGNAVVFVDGSSGEPKEAITY